MTIRPSEVAAAWRGRAERLTWPITPMMGLLAVLVLGAVLRGLGLQQLGDFDFDEVASVWYARSVPLDIIAAIAEAPFEHPPLYYVALHYWVTWFGEQEPLVRWLSVPFGLLLIPATYQLARTYLRPWPAVFAAGVVAVSPLLIFFSREARMYAAAALFGTLALWLFERAMRRGRPRDWLWLALTIVVGAYVDYTAALAVVAMNLSLPWRYREQRRRVLVFIAIELACLGAALPWVLLARGVQDSLPAFGTGGLGLGVVREVATSAWLDVFVGDAAVRGGGRAGALVAGVLGALALSGAALALVRRVAGLLLAKVAAVLGFLALLLIFDKEYQSRYLLPAIPALAILAAVPFSLAPRRFWVMAPAAVIVVAALAGPIYASRAYYDDYRRGDYRSITSTIENLARPRRPGRDEGKFRDAVVLAGPWQGWYWRHYFPEFLDKVDVWFLPDEVPPAVTAKEVNKKLQRAVDNHRRLWVVLAGLEQADPEGHVEGWLSFAMAGSVRDLSERCPPALHDKRAGPGRPSRERQTRPRFFDQPYSIQWRASRSGAARSGRRGALHRVCPRPASDRLRPARARLATHAQRRDLCQGPLRPGSFPRTYVRVAAARNPSTTDRLVGAGRGRAGDVSGFRRIPSPG